MEADLINEFITITTAITTTTIMEVIIQIITVVIAIVIEVKVFSLGTSIVIKAVDGTVVKEAPISFIKGVEVIVVVDSREAIIINFLKPVRHIIVIEVTFNLLH